MAILFFENYVHQHYSLTIDGRIRQPPRSVSFLVCGEAIFFCVFCQEHQQFKKYIFIHIKNPPSSLSTFVTCIFDWGSLMNVVTLAFCHCARCVSSFINGRMWASYQSWQQQQKKIASPHTRHKLKTLLAWPIHLENQGCSICVLLWFLSIKLTLRHIMPIRCRRRVVIGLIYKKCI